MKNMFHIAIKELSRRKRLHLLSAVTIAMIMTLIVVLNGLGTAYADASRLPFQAVNSTIIIQKSGNVPEDVTGVLLSCSLAPIHATLVDEIGGLQGVKTTSAALSLWVFDPDYFKQVLGVNWDDSFGTILVEKVVEGAAPATDDEALLEKTYALQHGLGVGQEIEIAGRRLEVSGIIQTSGNELIASDVYVGLATAQSMAFDSTGLQAAEPFERTDVNVVLVEADQTGLTAVTREIDELLVSDVAAGGQTPLGQTIGSYNVYTPESFDSQISSLFVLSDRLIWLISLVAFVGGALLIARNSLHSTMERSREFGIMKAVGFTSHDIRKTIFIESLLLAVAGSIAGLAISGLVVAGLAQSTITIAIPWELTAYPHFLLSNPEDANMVQSYLLPITMAPSYVIAALGTAGVVSVLAAFAATWQVNRLSPMRVMRHE
jgi:putative ABC transport system permease protein